LWHYANLLHLQNFPALSDEQIKLLAYLAKELEAYFGYAVNIEFAFQRGELYILQVRPITTFGRLIAMEYLEALENEISVFKKDPILDIAFSI
jgi:phosphoenolpyruvate synthase/pyruvate phosphate dikinase